MWSIYCNSTVRRLWHTQYKLILKEGSTGCRRQIEPTILVTFQSSNTVQVGQLCNPMMIWDTLVGRWDKITNEWALLVPCLATVVLFIQDEKYVTVLTAGDLSCSKHNTIPSSLSHAQWKQSYINPIYIIYVYMFGVDVYAHMCT